MDFISNSEFAMLLQLIVATLLGMTLGIERFIAGKTAGPRTYGLVSMGACMLTILSLGASAHYPLAARADPVPIVSAIITGIGFIGAGLIIFKKSKLSGLTTAAGIWVSAAIGIAVGFGDYLLASFATFLTVLIFTVMWRIERKIKKNFPLDPLTKEDQDML